MGLLPVLLLVAHSAGAPATVTLSPTDDVWAYPHASDQDTDEYLRVWGTDGLAVWPKGGEPDSFGISLLKFDLTSVVTSGKLKAATLTLIHADGAEFELKWVKESPLQVRACPFSVNEKKWTYGQVQEARPSDEKAAIFGIGFPTEIPKVGTFPINVDLFAGPADFKKFFETSRNTRTHEMNLALTSAINPSDLGRAAVYKMYSRNADDPKVRPTLKLEFE